MILFISKYGYKRKTWEDVGLLRFQIPSSRVELIGLTSFRVLGCVPTLS